MIKSFLKYVFIGFVFLFVVVFFISAWNVNKENTKNKSIYSSKEKTQLTDKQKSLLRRLENDEATKYSHGNYDTLIERYDQTITRVTAPELSKAYNNNEIKADGLYRNKEVIVFGKIDSINRGIGESYYLLLQGNEMFATVHAEFDGRYKNTLSELKKGQAYLMHCICDGMLMASPILKKCKPVRDWIDFKTEELVFKTEDLLNSVQHLPWKKFITNEAKISEVDMSMFALATLALALPSNSPLLDPEISDKKFEELLKLEQKKLKNVYSEVLNSVPESQRDTILVKDIIALLRDTYLKSTADTQK